MLDKLAGYKTYLFVVFAMAWTLIYLKVPDAKETIGADNFQVVLAFLLGGAGISFKSAQGRVEEKVSDIHSRT